MANVMTGAVYRGDAEINAAIERGEPVVEVSETVAHALEAGMRELSAPSSSTASELVVLRKRIEALEAAKDFDERVKRLGYHGIVITDTGCRPQDR